MIQRNIFSNSFESIMLRAGDEMFPKVWESVPMLSSFDPDIVKFISGLTHEFRKHF